MMKRFGVADIILRRLNDVSAFISTANSAHMVRFFQFTALVARNHPRYFQAQMSAALIAAGFGSSSSWNRHVEHLLRLILMHVFSIL